jgi:hypothetical protein
MYIQCNIVARSRNHCSQVNATERSLYIVDVPTSLSTMQYNYKRCHGNRNAFCVLLRYICRCQQYETHWAPQVKCRCFCTILTESEVRKQIFIEDLNTKFHENPSSERRADTCGRTHRGTSRR